MKPEQNLFTDLIPVEPFKIPEGGYKTIVIDPPWEYGKWGKASDCKSSRKKFPNGQGKKQWSKGYNHLSIEEIKKLKIYKLAAKNCELYLWVTSKYLPTSFEIIKTWGFKYCQTLVWCKTPMGTGQGGLYCPTTEFLILGRKGKMPNKKRINSTWWNIKRTMRHSQKPEFFQDMIEHQSDEPRIELFARRSRPGWDCIGNEINGMDIRAVL